MEYQDSYSLLSQIKKMQPHVVILDLDPPRKTGLTAARQLLRCDPKLRILITGVPNQDAEVIAVIEAGAMGYVTPESGMEDLLSNIKTLASGQAICSPRIARLLFQRVAKAARSQYPKKKPTPVEDTHLTPRELQVMALIEEGLSNKEIARRLSIEQQTVKNHVHHVLVKLSLRRRTEVAHYVRQHGLGQSVGY